MTCNYHNTKKGDKVIKVRGAFKGKQGIVVSIDEFGGIIVKGFYLIGHKTFSSYTDHFNKINPSFDSFIDGLKEWQEHLILEKL